MDIAPDVPLDVTAPAYMVAAGTQQLWYNPTVQQMSGGAAGSIGGRNHQLGVIEKHDMSHHVFESNYHQFISKGVAMDPSATAVQRAADSGASASQALIFNNNRTMDHVAQFNPRVLTADDRAAVKERRKAAAADAGDVENWRGPWASRETKEDEDARKVEGRVLTEAQTIERDRVRAMHRKRDLARAAAASGVTGIGAGEDAEAAEAPEAKNETTTFHGTEERDYQGRTYMYPPSGLNLKTQDLHCYLPKRLIHTFTGHTKGVNAIKYFPHTGHLLLSASNDHTVKIWNVVSSAHGGYKCLRTFSGHTEGVRGMDFNYDGTKFMTCSFDKYVKVSRARAVGSLAMARNLFAAEHSLIPFLSVLVVLFCSTGTPRPASASPVTRRSASPTACASTRRRTCPTKCSSDSKISSSSHSISSRTRSSRATTSISDRSTR
jgi:pre-mRNA-processing factor 17